MRIIIVFILLLSTSCSRKSCSSLSYKFVRPLNNINLYEGIANRILIEHNYDSIKVLLKNKEVVYYDGFYDLRILNNYKVIPYIDTLKIFCYDNRKIYIKNIQFNVDFWGQPKMKIIFPNEIFTLNDTISKLMMSYLSGFNLSIEEPENYPCDVISFRYMIIRRDSVIFNFIACNNGSLFPDEVMSQNKQIKSKDIIIINDIEYMCDVNHKKNKPVLILHIE